MSGTSRFAIGVVVVCALGPTATPLAAGQFDPRRPPPPTVGLPHPPAGMTVELPGASSLWFAGSGRMNQVRWTRRGTPQPATVNIALFDESCRTLRHALATGVPNNGSAWVDPLPALGEGQYTVRVQSSDGLVRGCSPPFAVRSPYLVTVAAGDWVVGRANAVGWRTTEPASVRVRLELHGGSLAFRYPVATLVRDMGNTGRADVTIPAGTPPGTYWICLLPLSRYDVCFYSGAIRVTAR